LEKICSLCDAILYEEDKRCPYCIATITVYDDGLEYECPICGTKLPSNQIRCPVCETIFELEGDAELCEEVFECPDCGRMYEKPVTVCHDCGSEFEDMEEEVFIKKENHSPFVL
jgi:predicted amidophosphoribosyltransferase